MIYWIILIAIVIVVYKVLKDAKSPDDGPNNLGFETSNSKALEASEIQNLIDEWNALDTLKKGPTRDEKYEEFKIRTENSRYKLNGTLVDIRYASGQGWWDLCCKFNIPDISFEHTQGRSEPALVVISEGDIPTSEDEYGKECTDYDKCLENGNFNFSIGVMSDDLTDTGDAKNLVKAIETWNKEDEIYLEGVPVIPSDSLRFLPIEFHIKKVAVNKLAWKYDKKWIKIAG